MGEEYGKCDPRALNFNSTKSKQFFNNLSIVYIYKLNPSISWSFLLHQFILRYQREPNFIRNKWIEHSPLNIHFLLHLTSLNANAGLLCKAVCREYLKYLFDIFQGINRTNYCSYVFQTYNSYGILELIPKKINFFLQILL